MTNIPQYVSAERYSKESGLGVEEVKRLCRIGEIPCFRTEKGYYKIPVYENAVPIEKFKQVQDENIKLKTIISNIVQVTKEVN